MTKKITRIFTRVNEQADWFDTSGNCLCGFHVARLWDIPSHVRKVWITASTARDPEPNKHYRLRRSESLHFVSSWGGALYLPWSTCKILDRAFPDRNELYITVEYME